MEEVNNEEVKNKRKLVSIREAKEIFTIEGADVIEGVRVDGWVCVCKKGEFTKPGELGVYFEIDAFLPASDRRFAFLSRDFSEFEGEQGARLRTRKFKGQVAQGLFLPVRFFPELADKPVGEDVTEILGVKKWEPYMSPQLAGVAIGLFPNIIRKTDQERCLSGDTLISTESGLMTIKEMVESKYSGKVASFNHQTNTVEMQPVTDWSALANDSTQWLKLTTESGKVLFVTTNHKIWQKEKNLYLEANELNIGDMVMVND